MFSSRLSRNILSNYACVGLTGLIGFVLTPILFHSLQPENYGILVLALSIPALMQMLDLGLLSALVRVVSDLAARQQYDELRQFVSSVFYLLTTVGMIGTTVLVLLSPTLVHFFRIADTPDTSASLVLALVSSSALFALPCGVLHYFLAGCQDFYRANAVYMAVEPLRAGLTVLLLWQGFGLLALAVLYPALGLLNLLGLLFVSRRATIPFRPSLEAVNFQILRKARGFASFAFVEDNAIRLFMQLDTFLVARLLPIPNLAILAVARRFPVALTNLSWQTFMPANPMVSTAAARGDHQTIQKFLFVSVRNLLALILPLTIALFVWAEVILRLWVGESALAGTSVFRAFLVFAVFASLEKPPLTFLYGVGKIRFSAALSMIILLAGVGAGGWACARYGLAGLAITFAGIQTVATLLLWYQALKLTAISVHEWFKKAVAPALWSALPAATWLVLSYEFLSHSFAGMAASMILGALLFFVLFVRLVVGPEKPNWRIYARKLLTEVD